MKILFLFVATALLGYSTATLADEADINVFQDIAGKTVIEVANDSHTTVFIDKMKKVHVFSEKNYIGSFPDFAGIVIKPTPTPTPEPTPDPLHPPVKPKPKDPKPEDPMPTPTPTPACNWPTCPGGLPFAVENQIIQVKPDMLLYDSDALTIIRE
jgi:hypothetical protein